MSNYSAAGPCLKRCGRKTYFKTGICVRCRTKQCPTCGDAYVVINKDPGSCVEHRGPKPNKLLRRRYGDSDVIYN